MVYYRNPSLNQPVGEPGNKMEDYQYHFGEKTLWNHLGNK